MIIKENYMETITMETKIIEARDFEQNRKSVSQGIERRFKYISEKEEYKELIDYIKNSVEKIKTSANNIDAYINMYNNDERHKVKHSLKVLEQKLQPTFETINSNLESFEKSRDKKTIIDNLRKNFSEIFRILSIEIGNEWDFNQQDIKSNYEEIIKILSQ